MAQIYFINVITSNILNFFYLQFRKYGTKRILNHNDKYSTLEVKGALYGHPKIVFLDVTFLNIYRYTNKSE